MPSSKSLIMISFAILWVISLFAIAIAAPSISEVDHGFGLLNPYVDVIIEIYNLIPPNAIFIVAVISLLFVSRYLFKI